MSIFSIRFIATALFVAALISCLASARCDEPAAGTANSKEKEPPLKNTKDTTKELLSGQVVKLTDALRKRGIKVYDEEHAGQVVLETRTGELVPLVSDWRGRAFYQDERLRNRPVDLVVRRTAGVPYVQVLMIFTFSEKGTRQYTDYWCDICAIPMYEIKDCECCQGPIRLRFQPQELPKYIKAPADEKAAK